MQRVWSRHAPRRPPPNSPRRAGCPAPATRPGRARRRGPVVGRRRPARARRWRAGAAGGGELLGRRRRVNGRGARHRGAHAASGKGRVNFLYSQGVETTLSHLTESVGLKYPGAHTVWRLPTRVAAKVAAYNLGLIINRFLRTSCFCFWDSCRVRQRSHMHQAFRYLRPIVGSGFLTFQVVSPLRLIYLTDVMVLQNVYTGARAIDKAAARGRNATVQACASASPCTARCWNVG